LDFFHVPLPLDDVPIPLKAQKLWDIPTVDYRGKYFYNKRAPTASTKIILKARVTPGAFPNFTFMHFR